jgi:hypothetical protein
MNKCIVRFHRIGRTTAFSIMVAATVGLLLPDLAEAGRGGGGGGGGNRGGGGGASRSVSGANHREAAGNANRGGGNKGNRDVSRNDNRNTNVNRNTNINRNVDIDRDIDVDIDVDRGCCHGDWDIDIDNDHHHGFGVGMAIGAMAVTSAAIAGSRYYGLPPGCRVVYTYGPPYHYCGSVYYAEQYDGDRVVYVVVNP